MAERTPRIFRTAALLCALAGLALALAPRAYGAAKPAARAVHAAAPAPAKGAVTGIVRYSGHAPAPARIAITKDREVCGRVPLYDESLMVGKDGGIANAVVTLTAPGLKPPHPLGGLSFDQKDCEYVPHVLVAPAGSTIDIINSDDILHNIHTYPRRGLGIDMAQPGFKRVIKVVQKAPGVVRVDCDAHNWMRGWWYIVTTPYYAKTGADGRFTINDVAPGNYTLTVWQEKLGNVTRRIRVRPGAAEKLALTMEAAAK